MKVGGMKNEAWPKATLGSKEECLVLGQKRTSVSLYVKERGRTSSQRGLLALNCSDSEFCFRQICMDTRPVHGLFKQIGLFSRG